MAFGCPVCNGLREAERLCPACGDKMEDTGRLEDTFDDYSPYREIDDVRMTNGYSDLEQNVCMHLFVCTRCGREAVHSVEEGELGGP